MTAPGSSLVFRRAAFSVTAAAALTACARPASMQSARAQAAGHVSVRVGAKIAATIARWAAWQGPTHRRSEVFAGSPHGG
jgi:hypothetical protein